MTILSFHNEDDFVSETLSIIFRKLKIVENSKLNIALSGGTTPIPIYELLAKTPIAKSANFFQVDERYVQKYDEKSNQKMIIETLKPSHFFAFDTALPIEESLKKYEENIPPFFNLTILGIGEDGHTASIFPNTPNQDSTEKTAHTQTENFDIKDRLTLTLNTILKSKEILVLIKNKAKVLEQLTHPTLKPDQFPALHLLKHPNLHVHHLEV